MKPTITDESSGVVVSNPEYIARQKGREEVVRWIEKESCIAEDVWLAQLKEWGIER